MCREAIWMERMLCVGRQMCGAMLNTGRAFSKNEQRYSPRKTCPSLFRFVVK